MFFESGRVCCRVYHFPIAIYLIHLVTYMTDYYCTADRVDYCVDLLNGSQCYALSDHAEAISLYSGQEIEHNMIVRPKSFINLRGRT